MQDLPIQRFARDTKSKAASGASFLLEIEFDTEAANSNASVQTLGLRKPEVFRAAYELGKLRNPEVELIEIRYVEDAESRSVELGQ